MTPQEKYRKFYDHPEYWINAIEVECVNPYSFHKEGDRKKLTPEALYDQHTCLALHNWKPKFKPQEGDQFIKDLEEAVSDGCYGEAVVKTIETKWDWTFSLKNDDEASITVVKAGLDISLSHGVTLNGAAYSQRLMQLGYYV